MVLLIIVSYYGNPLFLSNHLFQAESNRVKAIRLSQASSEDSSNDIDEVSQDNACLIEKEMALRQNEIEKRNQEFDRKVEKLQLVLKKHDAEIQFILSQLKRYSNSS